MTWKSKARNHIPGPICWELGTKWFDLAAELTNLVAGVFAQSSLPTGLHIGRLESAQPCQDRTWHSECAGTKLPLLAQEITPIPCVARRGRRDRAARGRGGRRGRGSSRGCASRRCSQLAVAAERSARNFSPFGQGGLHHCLVRVVFRWMPREVSCKRSHCR